MQGLEMEVLGKYRA
jgi:hypothetical protein